MDIDDVLDDDAFAHICPPGDTSKSNNVHVPVKITTDIKGRLWIVHPPLVI